MPIALARTNQSFNSFFDLENGLADASLVVLSRRWKTLDLLTIDERHFRTLRGVADKPFRILSADS